MTFNHVTDELRFYVDDISVGTVSPGPEGLDPSLKGSRLAPYDKEVGVLFNLYIMVYITQKYIILNSFN